MFRNALLPMLCVAALVTFVRLHTRMPNASLTALEAQDPCGDGRSHGQHSRGTELHPQLRLRSKSLLCSNKRLLESTETAHASADASHGAGAVSARHTANATANVSSSQSSPAAQPDTLHVDEGDQDPKDGTRLPSWLSTEPDAAAADAFACHYFLNLDGIDHASWELQQLATREAIAVLRRLYPRHRCVGATSSSHRPVPETPVRPTEDPSVFSSVERSRDVLEPLRHAVSVLQTLACSGGISEPPPIGSLKTDFLDRKDVKAGTTQPLDFNAIMTGQVPSRLVQQNALPAGAFVAVRRLTLAVMHQLWLEPEGTAWREALTQVSPSILAAFQHVRLCGSALRPAMEMFHVSKSGGTSLCQLARFGTRMAKNFKLDANCLQDHFYDEPKWTRDPERVPPSIRPGDAMRKSAWKNAYASVSMHNVASAMRDAQHGGVGASASQTGVQLKAGGGSVGAVGATAVKRKQGRHLTSACSLWPAYECDEWLQTPEVSCAQRQHTLNQNNLDFYSNEHALHGSTGHPGAAHTCSQFESLVSLRDPLLRTEAHIIQIITVYGGFSRTCALTRDVSEKFRLERDLAYWMRFAPAIVDNYSVRSLLGKHYHCKAFGNLSRTDLYHAQLKLMTFDHILVLGNDTLNDVVFRLGLGWPETLRTTRLRWKTDDDHKFPYWDYGLTGTDSRIEKAGRFPRGSSVLLDSWNKLDRELYNWGQAALALDAQFLSTAAVFEKRVQQARPAVPPPPPPEHAPATATPLKGLAALRAASIAAAQKSTARADMDTFVTATVGGELSLVRTAVTGDVRRWDPVTTQFVDVEEVIQPLRLPVNPSLLLFGAAAHLPAVAKAAASKDVSAFGPVGLNFVCADSSLNGTRKVPAYTNRLW